METFDDTASFSSPSRAAFTPGQIKLPGLASLLRGWWIRTDAIDGRHRATVGGPGLLAVCRCLARAAKQPSWVIDGQIFDGMHELEQRLRRSWPPRRVVLVDGPVELSDAEAIDRALVRGDSPFDVELRTMADLKPALDSFVVEVIDPEMLDMVTIALLQGHVARCLQVRAIDVDEPELDTVLCARAGSDLLLRPIETRVMSGSVDVGLGRVVNQAATEAIIFDRKTGMWHTD
jgi:hypothetical protein